MPKRKDETSDEEGDPITGHKVQIANLELLIAYMRDGTMRTVDFDSEGNKFDTTAQSLHEYKKVVARLREALQTGLPQPADR